MKNFTQNPPLDSELSKFNIRNPNIEVVLKTILLFLTLITFENSTAQTANSLADINGKIDLLVFSNFPNLKYIYIVSEINITKQNIAT